jgi:flagellar motor switch protein FliM
MNSRQPGANKSTERQVSRPLELGGQENGGPQFHALQSTHEAFAKLLSNVLSPFLQSEIQVDLAGIRLTTVRDFQKSLPNPSCLITLRLHPEPERAILCLESSTALILLDLLLGGTGTPGPAARELTEIEWSLLEEVSSVLVRCLGESWQSVKAVEFVVESLGSDPSLMAYPDAAISALRISFELQLAEQVGHLDVVVPCSFFDVAAPAHAPQHVEDGPSPVDGERNARLLEDAEVEMEVHLQGARLTFGELLALRRGQVVRFNHPLHEPVQGMVNGDLSFAGHILSAGRKRAFQVEEIASR